MSSYVTWGQFLGLFETIFLINLAYLEVQLAGLKLLHIKSSGGSRHRVEL